MMYVTLQLNYPSELYKAVNDKLSELCSDAGVRDIFVIWFRYALAEGYGFESIEREHIHSTHPTISIG